MLASLLSDPIQSVRLSAAIGLYHLGSPAAKAAIEECANSGDPEAQKACKPYLNRISEREKATVEKPK